MWYKDDRGRVLAKRPEMFVGLPPLPDGPCLGLDWYDLFLISISGGKDSSVAMHLAMRAITAAGIPINRIHSVFADLGADDEWPGVPELASQQAARYGIRHHVTFRKVKDGSGGTRQQGLIEYIESRDQQQWPLPNQPYCRSDLKRGPIKTVKTALAAEWRAQRRAAGLPDRPARILEVMGIRAQESGQRRKQLPWYHRADDSNRRRHVDVWLPAHNMTETEVWWLIDEQDIPWHWVYTFLPRLSCRQCIVAPREQLIEAARLDPAGTRRRAQLADRMGHQFKKDVDLWDVAAEAQARGVPDTTHLTPEQRTVIEALRDSRGASS
jgi:3'-phosphoadenosine 5'-phosphosulfate sulfotransferase (PAPS reductase)/FAD synthetase